MYDDSEDTFCISPSEKEKPFVMVPKDQVENIDQRKPSFYAIIPAHVRYSKDLEMGAKLLYGEITALAHNEGYCWASSQYFADLYDVDVRTVKRWLSSLSSNKYIIIETEKKGFNSKRKIWVSQEIKEFYTKGQKCPPEGTKMSPRGDKNVPPLLHLSITKEKERERESAAPPTPTPPFKFKRVKIDSQKYENLKKEFGESKIKEMIDRLDEYADINPTRFKQYACHGTVIRKWIRDDVSKAKTTAQTIVPNNMDWAQKLREKFSHRNDVQVTAEGVVFSGANSHIFISFRENGFKEQILNRLRKMNLPVEGL